MNEFQLSLFALGTFAVGVVFTYNKWQERQHRKLAERLLGRESRADVMIDTGLHDKVARQQSDVQPTSLWGKEFNESSEFEESNEPYDLDDLRMKPYGSQSNGVQNAGNNAGGTPVAYETPDARDAYDDLNTLHVSSVVNTSIDKKTTTSELESEVIEPFVGELSSTRQSSPALNLQHEGTPSSPAITQVMKLTTDQATEHHVRREPVLRIESDLNTTVPLKEGHRDAAVVEMPEASVRQQVAPVVSESEQAVPTPEPVSASPESDSVPAFVVSSAIDYIARIELGKALAGSVLLGSQREFLDRISKPVSWAGCNNRSGKWERVVPDGEYCRLRVGLLLADRRGPVGEADMLTFQGAMQGLAAEHIAALDLGPSEPALMAAIELDQFCANVDIQIGLNVVSQGVNFPGTKIRALAEAAGMMLDGSGCFVRLDEEGNALYTLANQEALGLSIETIRTMSTHGLVFTLDVPRVAHGDRVFMQMLDLARRMAEVLQGVLVDDNRKVLTEAQLEPFRRQIAQYQSQLAGHGVTAGGPLAVRLFN